MTHRHKFQYHAMRCDKPRGQLAVIKFCERCHKSWAKPNGEKWVKVVMEYERKGPWPRWKGDK